MAAPRKTAASKKAAEKPVETVELEATEVDNSAPVAEEKKTLAFTSKPVEREVLFSIDDRDFTISKELHQGAVIKCLQALKRAKNDATDQYLAGLGLLESALGADQYNDLLDWDGCDSEVLVQLIDIVLEKAFGQLDETAGE